jgi:hypothetical protein
MPSMFEGRQCSVRAPQSFPYNDPVTGQVVTAPPGVPPAPGEPCAQLNNCCPTWMNPCCLDLLAKWLEQTLKNFQQHTRLPSHIDMPYRGIPLDIYPAEWIVIPMGAYALPGIWVNVVTYTLEPSMRGSIAGLGQAVQALPAWDDVEWRIVRDGVPMWPWLSIRYFQLWEFCPISELQHRLHFYPGGTITIQARNWNQQVDYDVIARMVGWKYPVRVEDGASIRATITD